MKSIEMIENAKVLIVDDLPRNLEVLGMMLRQKNLNVFMATSGRQAIAIAKAKQPDLILLDIQMPEMDGYEVCEKLKSDVETVGIPIIFLTARNESSDIVKGFSIGAVDYVTKPFNSAELLSRVFTHIELKRSKDVVESQNARLSELNAAKNRLFSIIAHDLKNPFSILLSYSEYLIDNIESEDLTETKDLLKTVYQTAKRGHDLLESLLDWAMSQTDRVAFEPSDVSIAEISTEVIDLLSGLFAKKGVGFINEVGADAVARCDRKMITTVIRNLVSNALKYTPAGGSVSIRAGADDAGKVRVSVSDTGVGMDSEAIGKLFRVDTIYTTRGTAEEKGTGLGLIICKEFVEKNGGKISVESAPRKGTTFYFTVPSA